MPIIPLAQIQPDPANVRITAAGKEDTADLVQSMKAVGLIQPIVVIPIPFDETKDTARYQIVAGHRRFAAATKLKWAEIEATVREPSEQIPLSLLQLSENAVRADMTPLDFWCAVERLAKDGMEDPAIAVALNCTEKRVAQMRAMSNLAPPIQAYIRETGDMPRDRELQIICQRSVKDQEKAWKPKMGWWQLAEALTVRGVRAGDLPPAVVTVYGSGPAFHDLFAEKDEAILTDLERVGELVDMELANRRAAQMKAGYQVAEVQLDQYGHVKAPKGADPHSYQHEAPPKTAKKKDWIYAAYRSRGYQLHERWWRVKPTKKAAKTAAAGTAEAATADAAPLTKKGEQRVQELKRLAVAKAATLEVMPLDKLAMAAALLLRDSLGWETKAQTPAPPIDADGGVMIDNQVQLRRFVGAIVAAAVTPTSAGTTTPERIGHMMRAEISMPTTEDDLACLKRPGLAMVLKAIGEDPGSQSSQRSLRDVIRKKAGEALTPEQFPPLAWAPPTRKQEIATDGCGRAAGKRSCDCGWVKGGTSVCDLDPNASIPNPDAGNEEDEQDEAISDVDDLGPEHADMDLRDEAA